MNAIFDGRYSWDGKKRGDSDPISWFPGAYDMKIIKLRSGRGDIRHLKKYMCVFTNTGSGYSVSANPVNFAKKICEEFSLELEKVIWVERENSKSDTYEVINFTRASVVGEHVFYTFQRREPMASERKIINSEMEQS